VGQFSWGIFVVACISGCGGDDSSAADAGDEGVFDAAPGADTFVAPDVAADVVRDVAIEADTGVPPLSCTGEIDEPNASEILATPLGIIDDCDSSGSSVHGVSSGTGDVDWMVFHGTDTFGCSVDPTLSINATGVRLCAFALCDDGTTTIQNCNGATAATSPAGTHGCCTNTKNLSVQINCSGTNDSAAIYVRVDQTQNQCVAYDVAYHY
jgi:hypothetical protein